MKTPRFADGRRLPDDEVKHKPDIESSYGEASRARMTELRQRLKKYLALRGRRAEGDDAG